MTELCSRSAIELAAMIRSRDVSSREVIDAHLARIEEVNAVVNAITVVLADQARVTADAADRSPPTGPLHGVPITVKENIDLLGTPTTSGLTVLADALPSANAPIVDRMLAAGAIPIGRTNLPELGLRIDTGNRLRGRTGNAWNPALTPGGSSGGEGAALGARMSPLGLGNDIGGSLRAPAFCNGVVGMRPTMHRVPHATTIEPVDGALCGQMMATDGPMARTVADVRLALSVLNGSDPRDPLSVDVALDRPPIERRVAGIVTTGLDGPLAPAVEAGVRLAADALAQAGWEIEQVELPAFQHVFEVWNRIMCDDIPALLDAVAAVIDPRLVAALEGHIAYPYVTDLPRMAVYPERRRLMRVWRSMFATTPVVVTPVWPEPQFPGDDDLERGIDFIAHMLQFATPAPLLGLPALALPTGLIDGLPVGVQIHADRWNDIHCLDAGNAIESIVGTLTPPNLTRPSNAG
jgi:amidase